jgi:hypothetical protein
VGWLHRLPYHPYQIIAKCVQVCLVAQLGREGFQGLPRIVLAAIEAAIYEALYATPQGFKQRSDHHGGDDYGQLGLLEAVDDFVGRLTTLYDLAVQDVAHDVHVQ